jgi:hypothetical protein
MKFVRFVLVALTFALSLVAWGGCDANLGSCIAPNWTYYCQVELKASPACMVSCTSTAPEYDEHQVCTLNAATAAALTIQFYAGIGQMVTAFERPCYSALNVRQKAPGLHPEDAPSCDVTGADNACVACAKASCCGDYQACLGDTACLCWVSCKAGGGTDTTCAAPAACGALNAVSSSAAACLDAHCASECGTMTTSTSTTCSCASTTPPPTNSGGTPHCTPGSTGSGEACFSNGDCASCVCNPQSMTCD